MTLELRRAILRNGAPEMVYVEACNSMEDAVNRELQLKRWSHAKKEALIAGETNALHALSKRRRK